MSDGTDRERRPRPTRALVIGSLAALALISLMTVFIDRSLAAIWLNDVDADMERLAVVASETMPEDAIEHQAWVMQTSQALSLRVTLIDIRGLVLADSHHDPADMDDHGDRPEVLAALGGEVGLATRVSATTGIEQRYVALPPQDGLVVRVSTSVMAIEEAYQRARGALIRGALLIAIVAVFALFLFGRRLFRPAAELADQAQALARGDLEITPRRSSIPELDRLGVALVEIARDLGGRVTQAEEATDTLRFVLGAIPQGTVLLDAEDRVVYANPAAHQILGVVPPSLTGLTPFQLRSAVREARDDGSPAFRMVDHGRPARRLRATVVPFHDDERVLLVIVDVTERERLDSVRRDFAANASHELKTPVATIIATSEALQIALSRQDESAVGFAAQIEGSAQQLNRLVTDLLDLSRLEQETPDLSPARLDLIVKDEVERFGPRFDDAGVRLTIDATAAPIMASHRDIAAATRNLLDNAVRHTPRGGEVVVKVGANGDEAVLTVSDTGEGIPSRDLDRVFERFYRVDTARSRATGGTGLGLAIVKHVAEKHGGRVTVDSELGKGSRFTVAVPLQDGGVSGGN